MTVMQGVDTLLGGTRVNAGKPGKLMFIHKDDLYIDHTYQRDLLRGPKVFNMADEWSWLACGALVVTYRDDTYWVVDGQHRLEAAKLLDDVESLPCVVFDTEEVSQEAAGFVGINYKRSNMSPYAILRANVIAEDPDAMWLSDTVKKYGLHFSNGGNSARVGAFTAIGSALKKLDNKAVLDSTLWAVGGYTQNWQIPCSRHFFDSVYWCMQRVKTPSERERLAARLLKIRPCDFQSEIEHSKVVNGKNSAKARAACLAFLINRGIREKFDI